MRTTSIIFILLLIGVLLGCKTQSKLPEKITTKDTVALFALIKSGDITALQAKITRENVNSLDSNGVSLLSRAILSKNFDLVKMLVDKGADPNLRNNTKAKATPLMMCSNYNLVEMAKWLIGKGADIDATDSNGDAVINWSAYMGKYEFTKLLLEKGARTDQKSIHSDNAISVALKEWQDSITELFIDYGKGINLVKKDDKPIVQAVKKGDIGFLQKHITKTNANLKDEAGSPILTIAAGKGHLDLVKLLIKRGAFIDGMNTVGHTALNKAVWAKHNEIAKYLIEQGANVNTTDERFILTPLIAAARQNNVEMGEVLIKKGAKINTTNGIDNFSPLMWAVGYGNTDFVKLLMQYKPDMTIVSKYERDVYKMTRNEEILKILNRE